MFLSSPKTKTLISTLIGIILLSGILVTFYGFWNSSQVKIPWENNTVLLTFFVTVFVIFLVIYFSSKIFGNIPLTSLVAVISISLITNKLWSLIVVTGIILSSTILGRLIINKIKIDNNWLDCFLLGIGIIGTIIGLLSHFSINYSGIYGLSLVAFCCFNKRTLIELSNDIRIWYKTYNLPNLKFNKFLEILIFTLILVYFAVSLMPELSHDSLAMHLFVPAKLASIHYWDFDVNKYVWALMPMLGNWIYSLAYMLGGETSARLINLTFILALCLILKRLAIWASKSSCAGYITSAIFLSSPLTFGVGASLLIESIWSAFVVAGILKTLEFVQSDVDQIQPKELILIALYIGLAVAGKLLAVFAIPLILIILVLNYRKLLAQKIIPSISTGLACFIILGCIPYLTAWIITGNPVFPFFNKLFKSPFWLPENFIDDRWLISVKADFLYSVTFETGKYLEAMPGTAGFQWLLLLPVCLVILVINYNKKGILLAVLSIVFIGLIYQSTVYLRYVFPAYAILCVIIGIGLVEIKKYSESVHFSALAILIVTLFLNLTFLSGPFYVYQDFPIQSILSDDARNQYLAQRKPIRNIVQITNLLNTGQRPVAILSEPFAAQLNSDALYTNWYNRKWQQSFMLVENEDEMVSLLSEYRVEYLILDESFAIKKEQVAILENLTDKVTQISQIQLRRVKRKNSFTRELLLSPILENSDGWHIPSANLYNQLSRTVVVDEKAPTYQRVKTKPDVLYLAQVKSRCLSEPTQGRVQVNWQDEKGQFIKTDIKVFDCTADWSENSMEVTAPSNAVFGDFFLTSHANIKMEINGASFKE